MCKKCEKDVEESYRALSVINGNTYGKFKNLTGGLLIGTETDFNDLKLKGFLESNEKFVRL